MSRLRRPIHIGPGVDLDAFLPEYLAYLPEQIAAMQGVVREIAQKKGGIPDGGAPQPTFSVDASLLGLDGMIRIVSDQGDVDICQTVGIEMTDRGSISGGAKDNRSGPVLDVTPRGYADFLAKIIRDFRDHPDGAVVSEIPNADVSTAPRKMSRSQEALFRPAAEAMAARLDELGIAHDGYVLRVRREDEIGSDRMECCFKAKGGGYIPWVATLVRSQGIVIRTEVKMPTGKIQTWRTDPAKPVTAARDVVQFLTIAGIFAPSPTQDAATGMRR